MVKFQGLSYSFPNGDGLASLTLDLGAHNDIAILGRNGAGKTTLLRMLAGELRPTAGQFEYAPQVRKGDLAYLPPDSFFYNQLTIAANIELFFYLKTGIKRCIHRDLLDEKTYIGAPILDLLDLSKTLDKLPTELSYGQRKKAMWVTALFGTDLNGPPGVIIMDEPESGVDIGANLSLEMILQRAKAQGSLVIHTTHHLEKLYTHEGCRMVLERGSCVHTSDGKAGSKEIATIRELLLSRFNP